MPRMWTQSSWRQKENALSCLFSWASMNWQETKLYNTLRQRGLYAWKGQRNIKCYPWYMPLVKQALDFPCRCSVRPQNAFQNSKPHDSSFLVMFPNQKTGRPIAFCCATTWESIDWVKIFQNWPRKWLILIALTPDISKQLKKIVPQIWLILKSMEWLEYPIVGVNLWRLSLSCERQVLTATK